MLEFKKNLYVWHPFAGLSELLTRCYSTPWAAKSVDLSIAMAIFSLPDLSIGSIKWVLPLLFRASAILPFLLACVTGVSVMICSSGIVATYGLAPWVPYVAFAVTFMALNSLDFKYQAVIGGSQLIASIFLLVVSNWQLIWPTYAIAMSITLWAVLASAGSVVLRKSKTI